MKDTKQTPTATGTSARPQTFSMTRTTDAQGHVCLVFPDFFSVPGHDGDQYPAIWKEPQPSDPTSAPTLQVTFTEAPGPADT